MSLGLIFYLFAGLFGLILIFQDFKSQSVPVWSLIGFLIQCSVIGIVSKNFCYFPFLIFLGIGLVFYLLKKKKAFGMADYIVAFSTSFLITNDSWPFFIILCGSFGILLSILFRSRKFPFIPGILMAAMLTKIFEGFNEILTFIR